MKNQLNRLFLILIFCLSYPTLSLASDVGEVVNNILSPISAFTDAFYKICYVMGALLIIGAGVQYRMYRKNPIQIRLSNIFFLIIIGIVVLCLPFIAKLSISARPIESAINKQSQQSTFNQPKKQPMPQQTYPQNEDWYNNYSH